MTPVKSFSSKENVTTYQYITRRFRPEGYWTTRGYANSRIANSRTWRLADWTTRECHGCHRWLCVLGFRSFGVICETASWPVREMSSPRIGISASCPVTVPKAYLDG